MFERLRHPELSDFIDDIQRALAGNIPTGTDSAQVVAEKNAILDELLPNVVRSNYDTARLDRMHRREQAVRWAKRRSRTLGDYVSRALMPPAAVRAVAVPAAAIPGKPPAAPAGLDDVPPPKITVNVTEKPDRGGFVADVAIPDFCERYIKDATHKRFRALNREWRVELMRTAQDKGQKPGFWLTLLEGKEFTSRFAFTVQGPDGTPGGQHTKDAARTWVPGGTAAGWGYSWEKYNVVVYEESTGTSQWVDRKGTLRVRLDLTRTKEGQPDAGASGGGDVEASAPSGKKKKGAAASGKKRDEAPSKNLEPDKNLQNDMTWPFGLPTEFVADDDVAREAV